MTFSHGQSWRARPAPAAPPPAAPRARPQRNLVAIRDDAERAGTYVEIPTRTVLDWDPSAVAAAIFSADSGDLSKAADLSERIMADARVRGILGTCTHGLFGLPLDFEGTSEAAIAALEGDELIPGSGAWWKMFPESELARLVKWGIMLGVGLGQRIKDPARRVGEPEIPVLRVWHPRWLRYQAPTGATPEKWILHTAEGAREIRPGDGEWILYTPYGRSRAWADGAWRSLAEAWLLKQFAKQDRARFGEVYGSPMMLGMAPQGASEKSRRNWLSAIRRLGKETRMVLPAGYDLKVVEASGGKGTEVWEQTIDLSDKDIAISLTGQYVTTEGTSGFSSGNIFETIAGHQIKFLAESISSTLRHEGLEPWAFANFGDPTAAPYPCWNTKKPADKEADAKALKATTEAVTGVNQLLAGRQEQVAIESIVNMFDLETEPLPEVDAKAPNVPLAPTDVAKVVRVDEARAGQGLPSWGGPDGQLSVSQFDQKRAAEFAPPPAPNPFTPGGAGAPAKGPPDPNAPPGDEPPPAAPPAKKLPPPAPEARVRRIGPKLFELEIP